MAAYTFAALFLAHVIADYLLQTSWIVANKRRVIAMAVHIGAVLVTMCLTTVSLHPGIFLLALAHLWIDVVKTYAMPEGLAAYVGDQALHVLSIVATALVWPGIWSESPLAGVEGLPLVYMIAAAVIFAARGGQYAVAMLLAPHGPGSRHGVLVGWAERAALCVVMIGGVPVLAVGVVAAKAAMVAIGLGGRDAPARRRLLTGTLASLLWGLAVAVPLSLAMPMMQ